MFHWNPGVFVRDFSLFPAIQTWRMGAWFSPSTSSAAPRQLEAFPPQDPAVTSRVIIN